MKLFVVDDVDPENIAMVQALYSRSAESVEVHLEKVRQTGPGKFMDNYVVGFNHKSIADCGNTVMFVENVSLLAAKAIQDNPLYCGQETSTRYIDMSRQEIVDPIKTRASKQIIDNWMNFYRANLDNVGRLIASEHPKRDDESQSAYDRAVKARAFDVMRGFLPAGICTQLSWATNLRQAGDNLTRLSNHPTSEMREIAAKLSSLLSTRYPSSGFFSQLAGVSGVGSSGVAERAAWERSVAAAFTYNAQEQSVVSSLRSFAGTRGIGSAHEEAVLSIRETAFSPRYKEILRTRPRGCVLPHFMTDLGQVSFEFPLDFGSFRDIQRQRNGVCRMPLLTTFQGFEPWYLDQLGTYGDVDGFRDAAVDLIYEQRLAIQKLDASDVDKQYLTAIGFRVPCQVTYALPALLYVLELRSSKTVHPSLRQWILKAASMFQTSFPHIALHVDTDPDDWTVRRGEQTITAK